MRILHIVEDFSINSGGLRTVVNDLNIQLKNQGINSYIISSQKEKSDDIFVVKTKGKWLYSKQWVHMLNEITRTKKITLIHIHGVWLYPQFISAQFAIEHNIPFILSFHGMLQPGLWKKGRFKKKIYFHLLIKNLFSRAIKMHAITLDEKKNLKQYFTKNVFFEIPNLMHIRRGKEIVTLDKSIVYLGRLNKSKGIELLIKAFEKMNDTSFKLKIAGGFNSYKLELDALVSKLNLNNRVEFLGLVKGIEKENLIKNAWVMASPSFSDVVGMVNLEAASLATPMITTYNTGLKEEWNSNGGILINPKVEELKDALNKVAKWSPEERNKNGQELLSFVKQYYSWEFGINMWINIYKATLK